MFKSGEVYVFDEARMRNATNCGRGYIPHSHFEL